MIIKDWKKDFFTIPNILSAFRILLIPVYVVIYLRANETMDYVLAASILAVSCLTDMIDGKIARRFNMISTIGKFIDPVADKLTQFTLIVCLAITYPILWSLAVLMFIKECFQFFAGLFAFRKGKMLKGALIIGKVCTFVLFTSLIVMVLIPNMHPTAVTIITIVDGLFMLLSFISYALTYFRHSSMIQDLEPKE